MATLIDRESSTEDAANQLGHSGTAVTRKHYIEKAAAAPPNLTGVLDQLGTSWNDPLWTGVVCIRRLRPVPGPESTWSACGEASRWSR